MGGVASSLQKILKINLSLFSREFYQLTSAFYINLLSFTIFPPSGGKLMLIYGYLYGVTCRALAQQLVDNYLHVVPLSSTRRYSADRIMGRYNPRALPEGDEGLKSLGT